MVALLLLSGYTGASDDWTHARCLNDSHLFLWEHIPTSNGLYTANTTVNCVPYECSNFTNSCEEPYNLTPVQAQFGLPMFLLLFGVGVFALYYGARKKHIVLTMFSAIMFVVIAMQSVSLDAIFTGTFFSPFTSIFVMLSWLLTIGAVLITLVGAVTIINDRRKQKMNKWVVYAR